MASVRILHFDDDPIFLDEFRDRLAQDTLLDIAEIESISSEAVFWQKLSEKSFDAIVLDVQLGEVTSKSGAELAAKVRTEFPNLAILLCSELHDVQFASRALRSAADDYIFKGADDAEIALRLRGAIEKYAQCGRPDVAKFAGPTMSAIGQRFKKINNSAITAVHVFGESGTGKEVVADLLEKEMASGIPFVRINCGALSPTILDQNFLDILKVLLQGRLKTRGVSSSPLIGVGSFWMK